jgi:hypothetical protein
MSSLFLNNQAIDLKNFIEFKSGMNKLITIEKKDGHIFYKHHSVYNLDMLLELYSTYGYEEQIISTFIEQLTPIEQYIDTEPKANSHCNHNYNAFLGIKFTTQNIPSIKRICDPITYTIWDNSYSSKFDIFIGELGDCVFNESFKNDFSSLELNTQDAILSKIGFCKRRGLATVLAPGVQLIKDVTQSNFEFSLYEFRLSSPIALRIYFKEYNGRVYIGGLEQKSNPNQDEDIKKAYNIIKNSMQA